MATSGLSGRASQNPGARRVRLVDERRESPLKHAAQHRSEVPAGIHDDRRLVSRARAFAGQRDRRGGVGLDQRRDDRARQARRPAIARIVRPGHRLPAPAIGRERARDVRRRLLRPEVAARYPSLCQRRKRCIWSRGSRPRDSTRLSATQSASAVCCVQSPGAPAASRAPRPAHRRPRDRTAHPRRARAARARPPVARCRCVRTRRAQLRT